MSRRTTSRTSPDAQDAAVRLGTGRRGEPCRDDRAGPCCGRQDRTEGVVVRGERVAGAFPDRLGSELDAGRGQLGHDPLGACFPAGVSVQLDGAPALVAAALSVAKIAKQ
jgi:hypothetical protein